MSTALAVLQRHRNVILIDIVLLSALYLVPSFSHAFAIPLYKLEPMRIALIVALLLTNRKNTYLLAFTIPLVSSWITGHPPPLKAVLMAIEFSVLVAAYGFLVRKNLIPAFVALLTAILLGKVVYYTLKLGVLSAGLLGGSLVSTPVHIQLYWPWAPPPYLALLSTSSSGTIAPNNGIALQKHYLDAWRPSCGHWWQPGPAPGCGFLAQCDPGSRTVTTLI